MLLRYLQRVTFKRAHTQTHTHTHTAKGAGIMLQSCGRYGVYVGSNERYTLSVDPIGRRLKVKPIASLRRATQDTANPKIE